jgi:hypothetical protein
MTWNMVAWMSERGEILRNRISNSTEHDRILLCTKRLAGSGSCACDLGDDTNVDKRLKTGGQTFRVEAIEVE